MFWQQVSNGIMLGTVFALTSIGYGMVYGMLRRMNLVRGYVRI